MKMTLNPLIPIGIVLVLTAAGFVSCQQKQLNAAQAELGSKQTEVAGCLAGLEAQNEAIATLKAEFDELHLARNKRVTAHRRSQGTVADVIELGETNQEWNEL